MSIAVEVVFVQRFSSQTLVVRGQDTPRWREFAIRSVRKKLLNVQIGVSDFALIANLNQPVL